jgi:hypothetical protein
MRRRVGDAPLLHSPVATNGVAITTLKNEVSVIVV